jgi:hypothetical protein
VYWVNWSKSTSSSRSDQSVDNTDDSIIGLSTMVYNPIRNLLVAAKADDIKADPFNELLREVSNRKFLGVVWFCEVDEERVRDFG